MAPHWRSCANAHVNPATPATLRRNDWTTGVALLGYQDGSAAGMERLGMEHLNGTTHALQANIMDTAGPFCHVGREGA